MQYLLKKLITGYKYCVVGLIAVMVSQPAYAQLDRPDTSGPIFGKKATGKWLIGVKAGSIDNNVEDIEDADAIGIVLGYEFDRPVGIGGTSTVELEYLQSDETNIQGVPYYEAELLNLFFTYRSPGTLYYKFKAGLSYSNLDIEVPAFSSSNEDVSLAAGIGLGVRIGDYGVVELEVIGDAGNNDLSLVSLSAIAQF